MRQTREILRQKWSLGHTHREVAQSSWTSRDATVRQRDGWVSLDDYLGRSSVLVGLFRGLHWGIATEIQKTAWRFPKMLISESWLRTAPAARPVGFDG